MKFKSLIIFSCFLLTSAINGFPQEEPKRELRSTWIATVSNLDWPKYEHRNQPELQKTELIRMFDIYEAINLNAVFLQVRPECDALYNSAYEPWSRYLTWAQGDNPGYDPLQFAIDEAHARGIEMHVWLNPYRINASTSDGGAYYHSTHIYIEHPEWAIVYDSGKKILNPGIPEVMSYIGDVVEDIVSNYNIDGVHFDDYFYSYEGTPNSLDQTEYDLYGNGMSRDDWRRDNVNRMIDTVYSNIQEVNSNVRFGVSPFGIYKNGVPPGIYGLDAYSVIYCDPLAWLEDKSVDYITPQLYWPTGGSQDFETLANWWSEQVFANNRHLYTGHGTYRLDNNPNKNNNRDLHEYKQYFDNKTDNYLHEKKLYFNYQTTYSNIEKWLKQTDNSKDDWTLAQIGLQIDIVRNNQSKNGLGNVFFRANDFDRVNGLTDYIADNKYTHKTLVPEMTWKTAQAPVVPTNIAFNNNVFTWDYTGSDNDRFAIYIAAEATDSIAIISNPSNLNKLTYNSEVQFSDLNFSNGSYLVITAVSPIGTESGPSQIFSVDVDWPLVELITPNDNQIVGFADSLYWQSSNGAAEFYLQISSNSSFSNIVFSTDWTSVTSINIESTGLNGEETYYWHVKARTDIDGPYSIYRSFITGFPDIPELVYPGQLASNISTLPVITWNATASTNEIKVVISEDINFDNYIVDEILDASSGQGQLSQGLNQGTWYYIKILAMNDYGESDFSPSKTFETTYGVIPDVVIISPEDNTSVASFDKLIWETTTTTGTISFLLEVSIDDAFSNIIYNSTWAENTEILVSELQIQGNETYYWHVKARSEFGESAFTEARSFITAYPMRPTLLLPANLSTDVSVNPVIEWSVDVNTDSVYVEFSENSDFNYIYAHELFDANLTSGTLTSSLRGYTWYYVHISAQNEYGYSVFSSLKLFETGVGNNINEVMNDDESLILYQDQNLDLILQFRNALPGNLDVKIYDVLGKLIYQNSFKNTVLNEKFNYKIERPVFNNNGIYIVSVKTENVLIAKKFIIK